MVKKTKKVRKLVGRFFVVNHKAPNDGQRTILDAENKAIEYAKELIAENYSRGKTHTTLYVVELKKVISSGQPPVTISSPRTVKLNDYRD